MEDFLQFLVTPLVSDPKALKISVTTSGIVLKVAPDDVGRVIGKQGAVINSIRTLFKTYCANHSLPPLNVTLDAPEPKK